MIGGAMIGTLIVRVLIALITAAIAHSAFAAIVTPTFVAVLQVVLVLAFVAILHRLMPSH